MRIGQYELYSDGRIYSFLSNKFLNPTVNSHGYHFYTIYIDGQQKSILPHIELWRHHYGEIPLGGIKHADGNKLNNDYSNLIPRHPSAQYVEYIKRGITITKIARHFKLPKKEISIRVAELIPGGIRELRKQYPMNSGRDIGAA